MTRNAARRAVFSVLFRMTDTAEEVSEQIQLTVEENPALVKQLHYITATALGVFEKREELDGLIKGALTGKRSFDRISRAALTALRLGVYEMIYADDVPPRSAINEAIEITKEYADSDTARFVNGVLGGVYKKVCAE